MSGICPSTTLATGGALGALVVDPTYAYYVDRAPNGGIEKVFLSGGLPKMISADSHATALAVDSQYLLWIHDDTGIDSLVIADGTISTLVSDSGINSIARGPEPCCVYYATNGGDLKAMSIDGTGKPILKTSISGLHALGAWGGTSEVVGIDSQGNVFACDVGGTSQPQVVASNASASTLATSYAHVFWATANGDVIAQSFSTTTMLATAQSVATNIAANASFVYWGDGANRIVRVPIAGGATTIVASEQTTIAAVAADDTSVYWTTSNALRSTTK